jgi:hypothetical protein
MARTHRDEARLKGGLMSVVAIERVLRAEGLELRGFSLDSPSKGYAGDTYALPLQGWALSETSPQVALEAYVGDTCIARLPLAVRRSDIAELFSDVPWASNSGFSCSLNALRLPTEFSVDLRVSLRNGDSPQIATLRGRRERLAPNVDFTLNPILLTTLGRTGSTWLSHSLGQHPSIVTCEPFRYEARISSYWMNILVALSDEASYMQTLQGDLSGEHWWLGRGPALPQDPLPVDEPLLRWWSRDHVRALIDFAFQRIDDFYQFVARDKPRGSGTPLFFLEKAGPNSITANLLLEAYESPKELLLVRDFRDMLASILAYNRKWGYEGFGRDTVDTDAEYIDQLARDVRLLYERWAARRNELLVVRYEDLILSPVTTLEEVFAYLDVDESAQTVEAVRLAASKSAEAAQVQHQTSRSQDQSVGRWCTDLTPELIDRSQRALGPYLDAFGYTTSREGSHASTA